MRMSSLFLRTLREDPADAELPGHKLLVRAGYIRRAAPGVYTWLPLGLKVLRITILSGSGTWNKSTDAIEFEFEEIGAGGGGGGGARQASTAAASGGAGGTAGAVTKHRMAASEVAASCAYSCGVGGTATDRAVFNTDHHNRLTRARGIAL